ncbi:MAG: hypothetical protein P0111_09385 [Nitrospira sp.]|nr:hypothetical protein [Nitrospira sp.]
MAKRRTIRDNPLDAIAPASTAGQGDEPSAETKFRSAGRVSATKTPQAARPASIAANPENTAAPSAHSIRTTSAAQGDLLRRIESVEEKNELMKWLVYGAIGLALLL